MTWFMDKLTSLIYTSIYGTSGLVTLAVLVLYWKQDSLLYFPAIGGMPKATSDNPTGYRSPSDMGVPFDEFFIPTDEGVKVHAWLLKADTKGGSPLDDDAPATFVFFHGNAGNIGFRLPNAYRMWKLGYNVLMVEYRGYGDSVGEGTGINEKGLKIDAEGVIDWISSCKRVNSDKIFLFGRSLGGAVAFHLAEYAQRKNIRVRGVIVENTFTSISDMVDRVMPLVAPLKGLVLRIGWKSREIVGKLEMPILYISGRSDELVPRDQMDELYKLSAKSVGKRLYSVPDGTHNDTWMKGGERYWRVWKEWTDGVLGETGTFVGGHQRVTVGVGVGVEVGVGGEQASIPIMPKSMGGIMGEGLMGGGGGGKATNGKDKKIV